MAYNRPGRGKAAGGGEPLAFRMRREGRLRFMLDTTGFVVLGGLVALLLVAAARWSRRRREPGARDDEASAEEIRAAIDRLEKRVEALEILLSEPGERKERP